MDDGGGDASNEEKDDDADADSQQGNCFFLSSEKGHSWGLSGGNGAEPEDNVRDSFEDDCDIEDEMRYAGGDMLKEDSDESDDDSDDDDDNEVVEMYDNIKSVGGFLPPRQSVTTLVGPGASQRMAVAGLGGGLGVGRMIPGGVMPSFPRDSNVKLTSICSTDVAVAQFAENNILPADVAMLNMVLWNLQQQQLFQMHMLHQLQQQVMYASVSGTCPNIPGLRSVVSGPHGGLGSVSGPHGIGPVSGPHRPVLVSSSSLSTSPESHRIIVNKPVSCCQNITSNVMSSVTSHLSSVKSHFTTPVTSKFEATVVDTPSVMCHPQLSSSSDIKQSVEVNGSGEFVPKESREQPLRLRTTSSSLGPVVCIDDCNGGLSATNPVNPMIAMVDSKLLQQRLLQNG